MPQPYGDDKKKKMMVKKKKSEAVDMGDGLAPSVPKLVIMSDGTPNGSRVFVQGQEIDPEHMHFHCRKPDPNSEYDFEKDGECSFSMGIVQQDGEFTKTVTVQMRSKADQDLDDELTVDLPPEAKAVVRAVLARRKK